MTVITTPTPAAASERSKNPLRPYNLDAIIGQEKARALMRRALDAAYRRREPLDHVLIVASSGLGKSTLSHAVANELGVDVYEIEAPISYDTLCELRLAMMDGDILKIEEIHQQGIMDRRGRQAATQPEVLYSIMEDRTMPTQEGVKAFPKITIMGTTTDEGLLPDAFINRFAIRPRLEPYTPEQLATIANWNAEVLRATLSYSAALVFARASRGVPRQINNFVKNAVMYGSIIDEDVAYQVLEDNAVTEDGLTADMQAMLKFLVTRAERMNGQGHTVYQASVNTIATAIGKSRDSKAVALRVEPYLIEQGYVQVGHGGRLLTPAGVRRARELLAEGR